MADESTDYSNVLSRRRFVELTGVTGAAALAGCDGGDGDTPTDEPDEDTPMDGDTDTPTDGDGGGLEYPDVEHFGGTTTTPADVQFNPQNPSGAPQISHHLIFEKLAQYSYVDGGYMPAAFTEWNFTGDAVEIQLREGLTWSNGDDVTSEDVVRQFEVWETMGHTMFDWASGYEATGDYTVEVSVGSSVNPALIEFDLLEGWLRYPADPFEDIKGSSEDLTSTAIDDPITNGIFQFDSADEQKMLTTRFGDHPDAGNVNFGNYSFNFIGGGGNTPRRQGLLSLETDSEFSLAAPARVVADFPDAVEEVRPPSKWGFGLQPNHNNQWLGDRSMRQAVMHAVNREACVQNSLPRAKQPCPIPNGIASDNQEQWIGDSMDSFEDYGVGARQTDQVATVLEGDGYSQVDGNWEDSDGNAVTLPVSVPGGWSDWVLVAETIRDHLQAAGFQTSVDSISGGNYGPRRQNGDFTMIASGWLPGAPIGSYPYYSLREWLYVPTRETALAGYAPWRDGEEFWAGSGAEITVPSRDGSGSTTVSPGDQLSTLSTSTDDDEISSIVTELAWAANQDLPILPFTEKREQSFYTSDQWDVPAGDAAEEDSDAMVRWAPTWLPQVGKMNYTG